MGVHVNQLDAATRKRLGLPGSKGRTHSKPSRATTAQPTPGHCTAPGCDWVGSDRHDNARDCRKRGCDCFLAHTHETGHTRIELETTDGDC